MLAIFLTVIDKFIHNLFRPCVSIVDKYSVIDFMPINGVIDLVTSLIA